MDAILIHIYGVAQRHEFMVCGNVGGTSRATVEQGSYDAHC